MGVSAVGQRGPAIGTLRRTFVGVLTLFVLVIYLIGPPSTPLLRQAAEDECNRLAGSNYRTYRLEWKTFWPTGWDAPHWECSNTLEPEKLPEDLGWWVSPW